MITVDNSIYIDKLTGGSSLCGCCGEVLGTDLQTVNAVASAPTDLLTSSLGDFRICPGGTGIYLTAARVTRWTTADGMECMDMDFFTHICGDKRPTKDRWAEATADLLEMAEDL